MKRISQRTLRRLFWVAGVLCLFWVLGGWKVPIVWQIETLRLPQECETVYRTKIRVSDVYWLHTKGEKVIQCEMGYEAVKAYVEEHNSETALEYIQIYPYEGMSDLAIYDSQYDEAFWQQPDQETYITISYFKKW